LHFTALKSDLKSMEILLKYKVDVNAKDLEGKRGGGKRGGA
jgi:hypothetical protein